MKSPSILLGCAQTVLWACTFYLLPALMAQLEGGSPWSKLELSSAMTLALVASAATAPFVGKGIDAGHGRAVMMAGGAGAALLLLLFSQAESVVALFGIWAAIGMCMAAMLYDPCFSMVTRHYAADARPIIIRITLIAGFAGTIGFPVANWIAEVWTWQAAATTAGLVIAVLGLPLTWLGLTNLNQQRPVLKVSETSESKDVAPAKSRRKFWLITAAFTLGGINHVMLLTHLLPLLQDRGVATQVGVLVAMCIGPMQVVGRLVIMRGEHSISSAAAGLTCVFGAAFATSLLWIAGALTPLIFLAASLQGACWGLVSIAKPSITRDVLGQSGFGATQGRIAAVYTLGLACAPALGAVLWQFGGYDLMLLAGIGFALLGGLSLLAAVKDQT